MLLTLSFIKKNNNNNGNFSLILKYAYDHKLRQVEWRPDMNFISLRANDYSKGIVNSKRTSWYLLFSIDVNFLLLP